MAIARADRPTRFVKLPCRWLGMVFTLLLVSVGCQKSMVPIDYVARVGDTFLYESDLQDALAAMPAGRDSADARRQIVEQWVVNTLLEQEARRRGLMNEPEVEKLLEENERSVLVSALVDHIYDENPIEPGPDDLARFFEVNKERMRLREPYLRVRYLSSSDRDSVLTARRELQRAMRGAGADSIWQEIVREYASDPEGSLVLSSNYFAETRLFANHPRVQETLAQLGPRQVSSVINEGDQFHMVQLVERVPTGSVPELQWVQEEISRQLILEGRKQTFARTVQNLRNMALARNSLEVRLDEGVEDD